MGWPCCPASGEERTLACGSFNLHENFFGKTMSITADDGQPAFTGCTAWGLERWVLAAFTQAQYGPREAIRLLRGMTAGFFAYALFCFTVSVAIEPLGTAPAFLLATTLALLAQTVAVLLTRRGRQPLTVEAVA